MWWPMVTLIGFLVLIGVVIALGTRSTRRYEQDQQEQTSVARPPLSP
jgi:hypothetical protein